MSFTAVDPVALRRGGSHKWNAFADDVLPAWVADMDFVPAAPIREALAEAARAGDFRYGVSPGDDPLRELFAARCRSRYGWTVSPGDVRLICDVVQGLYVALWCFTEPGEGAIVTTPIYPPFLAAPSAAGRRGVFVPLAREAAGYVLDLDAMQRAVDRHTRLLMLCSPHNPCGRAWRRDELEALAELVLRNDLLVVSDEIHADLVLDARPHVPFASLGPEVAARTLTLMSASKAFNIAGLRCALAVPGSEALRRRMARLPARLLGNVSTAGTLAARVAWQAADGWLQEALAALRGNRGLLLAFLRERLPAIGCVAPEATYLAWLDLRALALPRPPAAWLLEHARVALSEGTDFGAPGQGHARLNFATSPALLTAILQRIEAALAARTA